MTRLLKWIVIAGCVFLVLVVAAVLLIPKFVDIQKYKSTIEEKVAQATNRPFTLGDDMDLSVFPWVGVKLTDLHLGSGPGFTKKDMVSVKKFEVRLKVMPLFSKKIEVKTFVMDQPEIYLEKLKNGQANWQGIGQPKKAKEKPAAKKPSKEKALPIEGLLIGNFSITNGRLVYDDKAGNMKKEVTDFNLTLSEISLETPVKIAFGAKVDGKPVSLEGSAGPIGKEPGKGTINLDFALQALDALDVRLKGSVIDPITAQTIDMNLDVAAFSPRKLMEALGRKFPVQTKDPNALNSVALKTHIKGNPGAVSFSSGVLKLDDSTIKFSMAAKEFSKPHLAFNFDLDKMDLDRYLPPPSEEDQKAEDKKKASSKDKKKKTDYGPLRKLVLDGKLSAGQLTASGATVENVESHIKARNGIITVDPFKMDLYQGKMSSTLNLNVQKASPKTQVTLNADGIQSGGLIKDFMKKELIEGLLKADVTLSMKGDTPKKIKKTLSGSGELLFNDGAIVGIDLANMVRNVKSSFGLAEASKEKPRTDFAELKVLFTSKKGLINTRETSLKSPLLRVFANGDVNLPKELLDLRIEPKFVATLKGQGDAQQRSGLMVPVLVTGSFASPKIRPDLKGMIGGGGTPDVNTLKKALDITSDPAAQEEVKSKVKGFLKGLTN